MPTPPRPTPTASLLANVRRVAVVRCVLWLLALAALVPAAQAASLEAALQREVAAARSVTGALGVHVIDIADGREIYAYQADTPRILASNTKLLSTAAALDLLGADYQQQTPLLMRGPVYGGVLSGDLAVVGSGDPNLSGRFHDADPFAIFRAWGEQLRRRGVRRVQGDLYLVRGLFDDQWVHPDWPRDQLDRWYEAPVAALSFSDNCFLVRVRPSARPGDPAVVEQIPDLGLYEVDNQALTTSNRRRHSIQVSREPGSRTFRVRGYAYRGAGPVDAWVSVPDPTAYFAAALRAALAEAGIEVAGADVRVAALPGAVWEQVASYHSGLEQTLTVTNHRSQNFYAESLVKLLGAVSEGEGSWSSGLLVVRRFLASVGWAPGEVSVADGSGLSRANRATPRQMTSLLSYMYARPDRDRFLHTLPASGDPETSWHRRLSEAPYRGNVLAKTGTLTGVSTLSGYVKSTSDRLYAFSLLFNDTPAVWKARRAQDRLMMAIIDSG
jgi:D-alanyl-D-alanine carboxypeptidase/D-alanyl-D-alanine-endopeptidase (penicillin-binding protein 4)